MKNTIFFTWDTAITTDPTLRVIKYFFIRIREKLYNLTRVTYAINSVGLIRSRINILDIFPESIHVSFAEIMQKILFYLVRPRINSKFLVVIGYITWPMAI